MCYSIFKIKPVPCNDLHFFTKTSFLEATGMSFYRSGVPLDRRDPSLLTDLIC